jgi:pimeloyl-ACP methyl ester carboxylesterase
MAADLSAFLSAADVPGPYVVACHSYGGLIAQGFLALKMDEVAGMLFVDTNTERRL